MIYWSDIESAAARFTVSTALFALLENSKFKKAHREEEARDF
jgi:hypothetical protein